MSFKVSAPATLMLLGEHAVLENHLSIVAAMDKRLRVNLIPRNDSLIKIFSALGQYETTIDTLEIAQPFKFVRAILKKFQKKLKKGCELHIDSDFSSTLGFGSSAAVSVASFVAVSTWLKKTYTESTLIRQIREIVQTVQGSGSGADVAASVLGGIVAYKMSPLWAEQIATTYPLTIVYSGKKTPTPEVIAIVKQHFAGNKKLFSYCMKAIGECSIKAYLAIRQHNWPQLAKMMQIQQGLMDAIGVNNPDLQHIIDILRKDCALSGVKISGAGLGDCVIALGQTEKAFSLQKIDAAISAVGVRIE